MGRKQESKYKRLQEINKWLPGALQDGVQEDAMWQNNVFHINFMEIIACGVLQIMYTYPWPAGVDRSHVLSSATMVMNQIELATKKT